MEYCLWDTSSGTPNKVACVSPLSTPQKGYKKPRSEPSPTVPSPKSPRFMASQVVDTAVVRLKLYDDSDALLQPKPGDTAIRLTVVEAAHLSVSGQGPCNVKVRFRLASQQRQTKWATLRPDGEVVWAEAFTLLTSEKPTEITLEVVDNREKPIGRAHVGSRDFGDLWLSLGDEAMLHVRLERPVTILDSPSHLPPSGSLRVTVERGSNLPVGPSGFVFCALRVGTASLLSSIRSGKAPFWNETFMFPVFVQNATCPDVLIWQLYEARDHMSPSPQSSRLLGQGRVDLASLGPGHNVRVAIVSPGTPDSQIFLQLEALDFGQNALPRPTLGLELRALSNGPLVVHALTPRGPAMRAGVQVGDNIVMCNGKPIRSKEDFKQAVRSLAVGTVVSITVRRAGRELTVSVMAGSNLTHNSTPSAWLPLQDEGDKVLRTNS
eukprot:TRINITY_DN8699_c0_g1_i1.p1 TRINITY_DN8699_c0_g1~~TRINITY_DN8699_c0_g1_i1.p1  ORF type:complete len:436 (+),score=30.82 TRINITY_DN8699_c0_g1_i1:143-1450(+)